MIKLIIRNKIFNKLNFFYDIKNEICLRLFKVIYFKITF